MTLRQTQSKPGTPSEVSKNPVKRTGRADGHGGGQKRLGTPSETSRGSTSSRREVPGYRKGDEYNTGTVDGKRVPGSVTDVSANKVKKIGG